MSGTIDCPVRRVLVLGAGDCIGRAVIATAVAGGREAVAVADDDDTLSALRAAYGKRVLAVPGSVADDAAAAALAARLRALDRPVDGAVVAIAGDSMRGRVLDQPADALRQRLDQDVLSHLFAARHLLPLLAERGRGGYVLIGGPGAEQPWAGHGQRSIAAAAQRMLAQVLHDEARALSVRVQLLAVDAPVRTDANARHACSRWPGVDAVADHALALVCGRDRSPRAIVPHLAPPDGVAAERDRPALAQRCLYDARALLRRLAPLSLS